MPETGSVSGLRMGTSSATPISDGCNSSSISTGPTECLANVRIPAFRIHTTCHATSSPGRCAREMEPQGRLEPYHRFHRHDQTRSLVSLWIIGAISQESPREGFNSVAHYGGFVPADSAVRLVRLIAICAGEIPKGVACTRQCSCRKRSHRLWGHFLPHRGTLASSGKVSEMIQ